jgi:hypothetical protein
MVENILYCTSFPTTTTAEDTIKMVISPYNEEGLTCNQCLTIYTDDTQTVLGDC